MARTVLLADDSVTAQNMGRRILMDAGYEVVTVNNGSAALKKVHESQPDLIVLDVYMPGYGGLEVCQRLKESAATMKIPVLLTVGKMEPFKTDEAKRVRADGHIIKPFEASELLAALTRLEDKIVPQAENGRGRRGKIDTKQSRSGRIGDPAVAFDDTNTEQIAYLAEVKKRRSAAEPEEVAAETPSPAPKSQESAERTVEYRSDESVAPAPSAEVSAPVEAKAPAPEMIVEPAPELPVSELPASEFEEEAVTFASASTFDGYQDATAKVAAEPAPDLPVDSVPESVVQENESAGEAVESDSAPELQSESAPHWVAESVALTPEEASQSLDEEMRQAQTAAEVTVVASTERSEAGNIAEQEFSNHTAEPVEPSSPTADIDSESGAAFAAAAAAGAEGFAGADALGAVPADSERLVPSQAAVAWENWQRIRDSVMGPQAAADIAQSVAEIANASTPSVEEVPASPTEPLSSMESGSAFKHDALASIVDSVLAELKPKLMEEIAKKLAAEKK